MKASERYKEHPDMYFKDGRPKKKFMLCYDRSYIKELQKYYPYITLGAPGVCGGLRCPLYTTGCYYNEGNIDKKLRP